MLVLEHNLKARSESDKQDLDGVAKQANSAGELWAFPVVCFFDKAARQRNGFFGDLLVALVCVG